MSKYLIEVEEDDFLQEVLESDLPVVVDFWAPWCAPCQAITPVLDDLAKKYEDEIKVVKVNIDHNRELAEKYKISSIPNLLFFAKGEVVEQQLGFTSKDELERKIKSIL